MTPDTNKSTAQPSLIYAPPPPSTPQALAAPAIDQPVCVPHPTALTQSKVATCPALHYPPHLKGQSLYITGEATCTYIGQLAHARHRSDYSTLINTGKPTIGIAPTSGFARGSRPVGY